jgi:hypothetical protein
MTGQTADEQQLEVLLQLGRSDPDGTGGFLDRNPLVAEEVRDERKQPGQPRR